MPKGFGSIVELKGNRYKPFLARGPAVYDAYGKEERKTIGCFSTYEDAYQALIDGKNVIDRTATFKKLYDLFECSNQYKKFSDRNKKRYDRNFDMFGSIRNEPIQEIQFYRLQAVIDDIENQGYTQTINGETIQKYYDRDSVIRVIRLISKLYDEAIKNEIDVKNLGDLLTTSSESSKKEFDIFTEIELALMFKKASSIKALDYLLFACYTGLRPSELLNVKKSHVDLNRRCMSGMGMKTDAGRDRLIVLVDKIMPVVNRLYHNTDSYLVHREGKPLTLTTYSRSVYYPALKAAEIRNRKPYTTRDTFANIMDRYGVDKQTIKRMMGHTSYTTTSDHYIDNISYDKDLKEMGKIG